ncbi:MAG: hypothetical protein ACOH18_05530 [Candidatus Saccharimonadaceae bacterium]
MKNKTLIALYIVLALVAGALIGQQIERSRPTDRKTAHELVFATCEISRTSDLVTEEKCADVQVQYGIEYLCGPTKDLKDLDRNCWTEDNYNLERY